jgi:hypothetical protein
MKSVLLQQFTFAAALACAGDATASENAPLKFSFGNRAPEAGWTQVAATNGYSNAAAFGFEPGADLRGKDFFTSGKPFLLLPAST